MIDRDYILEPNREFRFMFDSPDGFMRFYRDENKRNWDALSCLEAWGVEAEPDDYLLGEVTHQLRHDRWGDTIIVGLRTGLPPSGLELELSIAELETTLREATDKGCRLQSLNTALQAMRWILDNYRRES